MHKLLPALLLGAVLLVVALLWVGDDDPAETGLSRESGVAPITIPDTPAPPTADVELEGGGSRRSVATGTRHSQRTSQAAAAGPTRVALEVRAAGGRPLVARIHAARSGAAARPLGSTHEDGTAEFTLDPGEWTVLASAEGFAPARAQLMLGGGSRSITLELPSSGVLNGKVLRIDGRPASVGVTVLAWRLPGEDYLGLMQAARGGAADPRLARSKVANDGTFRLEGLDPSARYAVRAVTPTDHGRYARAVAPGSTIELRLRPLYAKELVVAGANGAPLVRPARFSEGVSAAAALVPSVPPGTVDWLGPEEHVALALTALAPALLRAPSEDIRNLWVGVPPSGNPSRVGPIPLRVALPGYRVLSESIWLDPLRGSVPRESLALQPDGGMGRLSLELKLAEHVEAALRRGGRPLGALLLEPSRGQDVWLALPPLAALPVELPVPAGSYEVRFTSRDGGFGRLFQERQGGTSLGQLQVSAAGVTRFSLDLSDRSAVELEVLDGQGVGWTGELIFHVESEGGQVWPVPVPQAPYVLFGLPEGRWSVELSPITGGALGVGRGGVRVPVNAAAGTFTRETLAVPR